MFSMWVRSLTLAASFRATCVSLSRRQDLCQERMILFEIFLFNYLLHPLLVNRSSSSSSTLGGHRVSRRIIATIIFYPGKLFMEVTKRHFETRETQIDRSFRFTHSETLSNFYCDKCQLSMSANIKLTISQAPIVACFHLKVSRVRQRPSRLTPRLDLAFSIREKISIKNAQEDILSHFLSGSVRSESLHDDNALLSRDE